MSDPVPPTDTPTADDGIPTVHQADLGMNASAPVEDVVRFLGETNRYVPVAIGLLRQIAVYDDEQWSSAGDWAIETSINRDMLGDAASPAIVPPETRPQPRTELNDGIYASGL